MINLWSEERVNTVNDIITGIARRSAYKFKTKDVDELVQELWIKVLEEENKKNNELDLNLIAKMCYNKIVDIIRHDCVRNSVSFDELFGMEDGSSEEEYKVSCRAGGTGNLDKEEFYTRPAEDQVDRLYVKSLLELFPEGSKERIFLEFWATKSNVKDYKVQGTGIKEDGFTEGSLAKSLGYAGSYSSGYTNFRKKMKNYILIYFDKI